MEPFTMIEETAKEGPFHLFDNVLKLNSAETADHDLQYVSALRKAYPEMVVTVIPARNVPLRAFAAAGFATCEVDKDTDSYASWRGYVPPPLRSKKGSLGEAVDFAKFHYKWNDEHFILYTVGSVQYILKERRGGEHALGPSKATDAIIQTIGDYISSITDVVWVYDNYWTQSKALWQEVQKSTWDKVILDEDTKEELTTVTNRFFDSKQTYIDLGVPWKRGLIFYGPPGNGKTISIRALMHELYSRENAIPTLYVKNAPTTYDIGSVFRQARALAPCMLVFEDIETIVNSGTRSYFFNEMDGIESNDGLFVVASTNYLDRLDPGLTKRPSRFDRKFLFPLPSEHERKLYCEYWRKKLQSNKTTFEFPKKLLQPMAHITPGFSFAFLQECFVATMLALARKDDKAARARAFDGDNEDLDDYELWVAFKKQAEALRKEIDSQQAKTSTLVDWSGSNLRAKTKGHAEDVDVRTDHTPHHCQCCRGVTERGRVCSAADDLKKLDLEKDEALPSLPWYHQKGQRLTATAFEMTV